MKIVVTCLSSAAFLCACATDPALAKRDDSQILVAPTGSNMMRKPATRADGVTSYDSEALEDGRRRAVPTAPAGGGPR